MNPRIYKTNGYAFTDITSGQTAGCEDPADFFPTGKGWDVVSGWGTPVFSKLQTIFSI